MLASHASAQPLFDPYDPELWQDPYPIYWRLRDEHPVYFHPTRRFWVLSRFEDVHWATRTPALFSSSHGLSFEQDEIGMLGLPPTFIMMDPPEHTARRQLIAKAFTRRRVRWMESRVRAFVRQRLDALLRRGRGAGAVDLVETFASPLPSFVVAELLGVPQHERERFNRWSAAIVEATSDNRMRLDRAAEAVQEMLGFFTQRIEELRTEPGEDLLSALIQSEIEGERLSDWDLLGFCFVVVAGGNDTTANLISNGTWLLDHHPDQRELLREEPDRIPNAVEEMLRYETPVQGLSRTTTDDVAMHGTTIPQGSKVHMLFASGNRDERQYGPVASLFDVRRHVERHIAFSHGPHMCIGAHFARLMARVAFEELLAGVPRLRVVRDGARRIPSAFARGFAQLPVRVE
jgi:hypothetical protein